MIITVQVTTRAKRNAVEVVGDANYKVWVTVVPEHGKANKKVINLLAKHFDVAKSNIKLLSGATSRIKKFSVLQ